MENQIRLDAVATKLRINAAEMCDKKLGPIFGFISVKPGPDGAKALKRLYNMSDRITLFHLTAGLPAEAAGLQKGDIISAMNGKTIDKMADLNSAVESASLEQPLNVEYLRAGEKDDLGDACVKLRLYRQAASGHAN